MSSNKQEYTLDDGRIVTVEYDDYNICRVTKECMELLIGLYKQGREDERKHIVGILFGIDRQVAELVKAILNNEKGQK